jgi:hypothetical protein
MAAMSRHLLLLTIGCLAPGLGVRADDALRIKNVPDTTIAYVTPVAVPGANCAAVNDTLGLLAFGVLGKEPGVALFRLDADGTPAATAFAKLTLPVPETLPENSSRPLSLAFHPKLPLLYVWQDVPAVKRGEPAANFKDLDHLLIFGLGEDKPELLLSCARGSGFAYGAIAGGIALNASGTRLYVPNVLRPSPKPSGHASVGFMLLDGDGLPMHPEGKEATAEAATALKPGVRLDAKQIKAAALAKANMPAVLKRLTPDAVYDLSGPPTGLGYVPISDDVTIVGGVYGPVTWDHSNQRAPFNGLLLFPLIGAGYHARICGHPTLPVVYASMVAYSFIGRVEHADGYLTLAPQHAYCEGAVFKSAPVFIAKHNQLAVGGVRKIFVFDLDNNGELTATRTQMPLNSLALEALTYSTKNDRLYVAVPALEKKK